jgi:succinate dehydrogenase/fumarate reductase cytochrome b subunit
MYQLHIGCLSGIAFMKAYFLARFTGVTLKKLFLLGVILTLGYTPDQRTLTGFK